MLRLPTRRQRPQEDACQPNGPFRKSLFRPSKSCQHLIFKDRQLQPEQHTTCFLASWLLAALNGGTLSVLSSRGCLFLPLSCGALRLCVEAICCWEIQTCPVLSHTTRRQLAYSGCTAVKDVTNSRVGPRAMQPVTG